MIYINLLPVKEIIRRKKAALEIYQFAGVFLCLLLVLGYVWLDKQQTLEARQEKLVSLQQEKKRFEKKLKLIKKLEAQENTIKKRISVVQDLKSSSSLIVHVLDEVAKNTPSQRIWLESLSQRGTGLDMKGMALDDRTIAQYMDDLESSPYIKNVRLLSSSRREYAGKGLKSFQLSCSAQVPDSSEPAPSQSTQ